ncbi:MAG: hypothetical protein QNK29_01260, partial [Desulfobacterales bacterium]|nr:hypothetical protein [Desulfobacterales bacterium]MDX2510647.1 hypothetical protein [Desulfobacterales bacterium]
LLRVPSDSASETVNRYAIVTPQQRYSIKPQVPSGDALDDKEGVVTPDEQEPPMESQVSQSQAGRASKAHSQALTGAESMKTAPDPALSVEKTSFPPLADTSAQKSSGATDQSILKAVTETSTTKSIEALSSIKIGPIIREQKLKKATSILHGNGIDFQQVIEMEPIKVTRLLEGLYPPDKAQKRFKTIQHIVDSAFMIPEKGKIAIYVATYHDRAKAIQKLKQLAQKNLKVTAVATELKRKGTILVANRVDQSYIETITDQMSKLGLPVHVFK